MVKKKVTSTDWSKFHESECDKDKRRGHDSNSKILMSLNDRSIAIPNVNFTPSQSTTIESSFPSFLLLESSLFNDDCEIQDHLLDKKQSPISPKRLDKESDPCSSFDMNSSLSLND